LGDIFSIILPGVNIVSLLFSHLLGTKLKLYSNKPLMNALINIYAICHLVEQTATVKKIYRAV
jgi:hypothetical protein